jgi:hypothetical protein
MPHPLNEAARVMELRKRVKALKFIPKTPLSLSSTWSHLKYEVPEVILGFGKTHVGHF